MSGKNLKLSFLLTLSLAVLVGVVPTFGAPAVVGSVAGSKNATLGGQALIPNTTLFSGDSIQVKDGAAMVMLDMGSTMALGRETVASFERSPELVTVLLGQGNVSMFHPQDGVALRVKAGDVTVAAGKGFKTLGEVAMVNGVVVVTAKEGMLQVEGPGRSMELTKGKTITIMPKKTAGSPQPQAGPVSGLGTTQMLAVGSLAGVAVGTGFSLAAHSKLNDVQTTANQAATNAAQTDADAKAATAAANQAAADASAAQTAATQAATIISQVCTMASPSDPSCVVH
jgi:hypothetical protein